AGAMVALRLLDRPAAASDVDPALTEALDAAQARRDAQITDMLATTPPDDVETSEQPTDNAYQLMADLGSVMEAGVAVTCDNASITQALHRLEADLEPRAHALRTHSDARTFNQEITAIWEARHLVELARTMLAATSARHESRGSLYRTDFPQRDDTGFLAHSMTAAGQTPLWQPVHIVNIEPGTRAY
ncbi:succinate dehydrogenase, partial [Bifidobacterium pseudolongum]|nr:succinate dehydrogenase [Bifidobacterium pseudolongum]